MSWAPRQFFTDDYAATATDFETAAWLLYPSRNYLPCKVRVTIDFLRKAFGRSAI